MSEHDRSVYPCDGDGRTDHVTDGSPCWCKPRMTVLCPECGEDATPEPACWRCDGEGLVDAPEFPDPDVPTITIHNDTATAHAEHHLTLNEAILVHVLECTPTVAESIRALNVWVRYESEGREGNWTLPIDQARKFRDELDECLAAFDAEGRDG